MVYVRTSGQGTTVFQHQADAALSQANPVSTTLYEVLATTLNARILSINSVITWATTQPTPLEVVVTIDGQTVIFKVANPVSAVDYYAVGYGAAAVAAQNLSTTDPMPYRSFLLEGRSIRVQVRVTWATTQPTPLVCRVKYVTRP